MFCAGAEGGLGAEHALYILAGVAGGAVLLIALVCCVVKCRDNGSESGGGSESGDDEGASVDIVKMEEPMGLSTPPGPSNNMPLQYVKYKALEPTA